MKELSSNPFDMFFRFSSPWLCFGMLNYSVFESKPNKQKQKQTNTPTDQNSLKTMTLNYWPPPILVLIRRISCNTLYCFHILFPQVFTSTQRLLVLEYVAISQELAVRHWNFAGKCAFRSLTTCSVGESEHSM